MRKIYLLITILAANCTSLLPFQKNNPNSPLLKQFLSCLQQGQHWSTVRTQLYTLHQQGILIDQSDPAHESNSLFWAAWHSDRAFLKWLLRHGANPNFAYEQDEYPYPLFTVTDAQIAKELIKQGATIEMLTPLGKSLLHKAIHLETKDPHLLPLYLEAGLYPALLPDQGVSLWHQLVSYARYYPADLVIPRAQLLAEHKVPADTPDPMSSLTPEDKIRRQLESVTRSFDPDTFSQGPKLYQLLEIIQSGLKNKQ